METKELKGTGDANEVIEKIRQWGRSHDLHDPIMQYAKVNEEIGEIAHELTRGNLGTVGMADAIGDSAVTLIILSDILGLDFTHCMEWAYDVIKTREGMTKNGSFIKNE